MIPFPRIKEILLGIGCLLSASTLAHATVTIELDAGILRNATGTSDVPVGGLLQIIASPGGVFGAPTPTSFTSGDNVVLANLSMNYQVGTGITDNTFNFSLQTTGTATGDELLLRWYPTLTTASADPGLGTTYGQFRSNTGENGGSAWVIPADPSTLSAPGGLNFFTTDVPSADINGGTGTEPIIDSYATNIVLAPEPSTYFFFGAALVGFSALRAFRRHKQREV